MNMQDILSKLDDAIAPKTVEMTKADFESYVQDQIAKAKAEKEKDEAKAHKRLSALRASVAAVVKAGQWEGDAGSAMSIPVFEEGYEKPSTMPTDTNGNMQGGGGTMGAGSGGNFSENGVPPTAASGAAAGSEGGPSMLGGGPTMGDGMFGMTKAISELEKLTKSLTEEPKAEVKKSDDEPAPETPFAWPSDLSDGEYLQTGIAKNEPEWGRDPAAE